MTARTICLILFDTTEAQWLIEQAFTLATALDAHVIGVHPYKPVVFVGGMAGEPMIYPTLQEWEQSESRAIRQLFEDRLSRNGLQGELRQQYLMYGTEDFALSCARGADFVIMGTNGSETRSPDDKALAERIIRNLGRPVLVMSPDGGLARPAQRIVIGWSETREATRAAHDALLLAAPGARISLVSIKRRAQDDHPGFDSREDFAAALDRQGFDVTVADRIATSDQRVQELLNVALEQDAELLVTGAFGHSQVYDLVIGAVTRELLGTATLPLLLSK